MQLNPRSFPARAQALVCALAVAVGLGVAPGLAASAQASPAPVNGPASSCASAQAAVAQSQHRQARAQQQVKRARSALVKASKAKVQREVKVKRAKRALSTARVSLVGANRVLKARQSQRRSACATPAPSAQSLAAGATLSLLGLGQGLPVGDIGLDQLRALLEQVLPGVTSHLDPAELAGLLAGFNAGPGLDPELVLDLLSGVVDPSDVLALLEGQAGPDVIGDLLADLMAQLSGLGGGLPIPGGLDPAGLWETFAGILGALSADQLGSLLAVVTAALGGGDEFDLGQLTGLIDSLVPGISDAFDEDQLASMLAGLNGDGLSADTLANLLGGQFSPAQLLEVINGTAGQALLGTVLAQVVAQLGTAGLGGLELPGMLSPTSVATLIATVTDLVTSVLGGGGVLPVVCGLIPIPVLCP